MKKYKNGYSIYLLESDRMKSAIATVSYDITLIINDKKSVKIE